MIEVKNLTKRYGDKLALDDISFTVQDGEVLGFLGPNGAGKTTTMNIITGYLSSTAGTVEVDGSEILADPLAVKRRIGYLPEHPPLYLDMTVREYLSFLYDLKKVRTDKTSHIRDICELVGVAEVYGRIIKNLSKGYRQRVGLAQALLGDPSLLILDEPTVGLDPKQIIEIRNLIKELGKKHTVILSSHILHEVQAACERVIVIHQGKLLADDTPHNLARGLNTEHRLIARVDGPPAEVSALLRAMDGVEAVDLLGEPEPGAHEFSIRAAEGLDLRRELFAALAANSWPLLALRSEELTLEDIFLQLTTEGAKPVGSFTDAQLDAHKRRTEARAAKKAKAAKPGKTPRLKPDQPAKATKSEPPAPTTEQSSGAPDSESQGGEDR